MEEQLISVLDWLLAPFYILIIFVIASYIKNKAIRQNPIYKYFLPGLFAKIFGAILVCLIYVYYYKEGGDTLAYHSSARVMVNLLFYDPIAFFKVWLGGNAKENISFFNNETGYPYYSWNDSYAWSVIRLATPLELLGFKSYLVTSILVSCVCFTGIWKLFRLFSGIYPQLTQKFAISVLFIPSVVFWGSGLLKDSWTIAAAGWFAYSFYGIFISGERAIPNLLSILTASLVLIFIKPYIFIALLPGCLLWGAWNRILAVKNWAIRILIVPFVLFMGIGIGYLVWNYVSSGLGEFSSMDSMMKKAAVSSEDLKQAYYQGNSFDLGRYDPSLEGLLSKFPVAVMAGLFRPYIWEAKNSVMFFSGLENMLILGFTLFVLFRRPRTTFANLFTNPLVLFCLIFSIFFAFSVAISTSNFGAMVRLRIPLMPFYLSGIILIDYLGSQSDRSIRR